MPDASAVAVNINTVLLALITVSGTAFGAWLTYRANATHKAVNSERTALQAELKKQNEVIAQLAAHLGSLTGSQHLVELAHTMGASLPILPLVVGPPAAAAHAAAAPIAAPPPGSVVAQIVVPGPPTP